MSKNYLGYCLLRQYGERPGFKKNDTEKGKELGRDGEEDTQMNPDS